MNSIHQEIKNLLPAYFALVMATGIISIAFWLDGLAFFAYLLFYINMVFLLVLILSFIYRCIYYTKHVLEDFRSYQKGPGFFTIVAALCIVGNQVILLFQHIALATIILIIAAISWLIIGYGFFFNITVTEDKKSL